MGEAETTTSEVKAASRAGGALRGWLLGLLGWLVPGLGHLVLRKYDRAIVFFVSVTAMAGLGLGMGAKLYGPVIDRSQGAFVTLLHTLGFIGDLGVVLYYTLAKLAGMGEHYLPRASGDYGTVFFLCAGLLNLLTALDAYDIAVGKKE
ncbi:MAG TPA: DUF6677 family protein [Candidatus Xenobia bacterium]|nr:DUF6677 family protein [Candidatus Xenobia bacterium]